MQKVAFTLCSNNYLAHAKTLGDSLRIHNPDIHFIIGLVDKTSQEIDYSFFNAYEILPYHIINSEFFESMLEKYNVIEFNTAVKPFYFEFLFKKYGADLLVYYLDPDVVCYSSFEELHSLLMENNFLITPHLTRPNIRVSAFETMILNTGIYNLGFMGIRNTVSACSFLLWWQERMKEYCLIDYAKGLFVDQIWINLLTVLFDGACVLKSPGYNMACWNFHERVLLGKNNGYSVNDSRTPLVFFHFSGFKPDNLKYLCKIRTEEFTLEARPDLVKIFNEYAQSLFDNRYAQLSSARLELKFGSKKYTLRQRVGRSLKFRFNRLIKRFFDV